MAAAMISWCAFGDAAPVDFGRDVQPIFAACCFECHGPSKQKGGLRLDLKVEAMKGGESGAVIVAGKSAESLLVRNISRADGATPMPPKGEALTPEQIAVIRDWIDAGAVWPDGAPAAPGAERAVGKKAEDHWAFKPLVRPGAPEVQRKEWARTPVDRFILARLEREGLSPSAEADRRTLIRRVTFDLHGLPPTPEELDAFIKDERADAYEKLVDRLLDSPRYGERWGRHWLDVAHFGETHGFDKDKRRDHAWPYRDYVIGAFNEDKPYADFIKEQIAGDVLQPDDPRSVIPTGFLAAGPWDFVGHVELREGTVEKNRVRSLDRDDMLATTMATFCSVTAHCARCHDHKFDPIPQVDYYKLQAVFAGIDRGDRSYDKRGLDRLRGAFGAHKRTLAEQRDKLKKEAEATAGEEIKRFEARIAETDRWAGLLPPAKMTYAAVPVEVRPIQILARGNVETPKDDVAPGALSLVRDVPSEFKLEHPEAEGSRRRALAEWIADPKNMLTWRSIVNRVWHYHFGRGLVDTPSDFGKNGSMPSHPELLDWLAVEFRDGGQSMKQLHRLILCSATYRQAATHRADAEKVDADNRLLWRMNRQKLEAEEIRDAVLAVSGNLDLKMGGPSFELFKFKDDHSPIYDYVAMDKPEVFRRTIYSYTVRSVPNPFLGALDCADPSIHTPARNRTQTALQALALLNDPFMVRQAEYFAERLEKERDDPAGRIALACELAFGREPKPDEASELAAYAKKHGMAAMCRLLFNANEFIFVD